MAIHVLKTWPDPFEAVLIQTKTFEVRKNDRNFVGGDLLILREFNPVSEAYTGREVARYVGFILQGGNFGIEEGYVAMSIYPLEERPHA